MESKVSQVRGLLINYCLVNATEKINTDKRYSKYKEKLSNMDILELLTFYTELAEQKGRNDEWEAQASQDPSY